MKGLMSTHTSCALTLTIAVAMLPSNAFAQRVGDFTSIQRGETAQQPDTSSEPPSTARAEARVANCGYGDRSVVELPVGYDFIAQYNSATWTNGHGLVLETRCDGQEHTNENGYACYMERTQLEDGIYSRALAVHPNWVGANTFVRGIYGPYMTAGPVTIQGKIGFRRHWETSKDGAIFSVSKRDVEAAREITLFETHHEERGRLGQFSSRIVEVQGPFCLILTVDAGQTTNHDWAAWVDVRVTGTGD